MRRLIILGSARCVWDDYARAREQYPDADLMAINDVGMHVKAPLHHWYSNDAKMLPRWAAARRYGGVGEMHTNNGAGVSVAEGIRVWDFTGGNSGINSVRCGLGLGYDQIAVCGVPLDNSGWYFSPPDERSGYDNEYELDEWRARRLEFAGKVMSLSGRTRGILSGNSDN